MQLQIKVFSGLTAMQSDSKLFERIVDVHDDLSVPYESLVSNLKFLFGNSTVVQFNLQ